MWDIGLVHSYYIAVNEMKTSVCQLRLVFWSVLHQLILEREIL